MIDHLRTSFIELKAFFLTLLVAWIAGGVVLAMYGYEGSFLLFNQFHSTLIDQAALFFTHFADVIVLVSLIFILMWKSDKALPLTAILVLLGTGLLVIFFKAVVFPDWHRPPKLLFENPQAIFLPQNPPKHHSFPSGHATSFLAGGLIFAWMVRKWHWACQIGVALISIYFCFTRVTLGVHFFGDILVGSMLGSLSGWVILAVAYPWIRTKMEAVSSEKLRRWSPVVYGVFAVLLLVRFYFLWNPA